MGKLVNSKSADRFIGMVTPIVMIYIAGISMHTYFLHRCDSHGIWDVLVIFLCSFLIVYGVKSLLSDLKLFGIKWILRNFFNYKKNLTFKN